MCAAFGKTSFGANLTGALRAAVCFMYCARAYMRTMRMDTRARTYIEFLHGGMGILTAADVN